MKKISVLGVFALKFLLVGAVLCFAQDVDIQEDKASDEAKADQSVQSVEKPKSDMSVVVTASRGMEQDPLNVPQSISIITSEEIESTVYTDVNQVLRKLPNVGLAQASQPFSASQGGSRSSSYWNEGFSIRGLGNQRVLVLTDGVRQSGQGIGYGGGNLSLYDVDSIQDIEVLKGPGSVLYGTDAFGGVVSVTTRNPQRRDAPGYDVTTRYAIDGSRNFNRFSTTADLGNENWGLVFGGSYTDAGDPNLPKGYFPNGGGFKRAGGWMKLDYFFKGNNRIRFIANETKNTHISIAGESIAGRPLDFTIPLYERSELGVEILAEDVSEHVEQLKAGFFWQGIRRKMDNGTPLHKKTGKVTPVGTPPSMAPVFAIDTSRVKTNDKVNTFEFQPQARLDYDPHTLTIGGDLGYDNAKLIDTRSDKIDAYVGMSRGRFVPLTPPFPVAPPTPPLDSVGSSSAPITSTIADAEQYRVGVYLQDNWDCDPFELVLGGRVDFFDVKDDVGSKTHETDAGFSGSIGLVYHYTQDTSYYCNLATGWRAPDLGERFQSRVFPFFGEFTVMGNPNLDPERSYAFEVGTKSRQSEYVQYSFATFINQIDDYIGLTGSMPDRRGNLTRWTYNNVGSVFLYGLEGSVLVTPTPEWELYVNGGRTFTSDSNKIAIPSWAFNYGTSYTFFPELKYVETIVPGISGRTVLESYDSLNKINFGGFTYFDFQVAFGLNTDTRADAMVIIGIKNVFDKPYREPFFTGFAPGRGVFASIQVDF